MPVVAVTGGVAAGKSMVTHVLADLGAFVIDADVLAREAVVPGSVGLAAIESAFGPRVITEAGELDRAALAAIVFSDESKKITLNQIVHPEVQRLYDRALHDAQADPDRVVIYDVPLLTEVRSADEFDLVVVVDSPAPLRHQRLIEHRGLSASEATQRINAQVTDDQRLALADIVLDSSGSEAETRERARHLYDALAACWPDSLADAPGLYRANTS
jgi:dephospho-CoA kinase